jgi:hypothetical protein
MEGSVDADMKAMLAEHAHSLPKNHPYRRHLIEHFDIKAGRLVRLDKECEFCHAYLE